MNILVAIDNEDIKKKIDNKYKNEVYSYDITFKEDVIDYMKKANKTFIIVTKLNLKGSMSDKDYIEKIREINYKNKIIIITNNLTEADKKMLFSNEVFNIIIGNEIDIELIYKQIESKDRIVYKTIYKNNLEKYNTKKVSIFGTSGAGKTFISYFIARTIAKYTDKNVVLDVLDFLNPCMDILSNTPLINCKYNNYIEDVKKNSIEKYITLDSSYSNLSYINKEISFADIHTGELNFKKLFNNLSKNFDVLLFDMPSNTLYTDLKEIFNQVDEILFVINPNYLCLKQARKYLDYILENGIANKEKVKIIINKVNKYSLDEKQIVNILKTNNSCISIKYHTLLEAYINGMTYNMAFLGKEEKRILDFLNINTKLIEKNKVSKIERWNLYG